MKSLNLYLLKHGLKDQLKLRKASQAKFIRNHYIFTAFKITLNNANHLAYHDNHAEVSDDDSDEETEEDDNVILGVVNSYNDDEDDENGDDSDENEDDFSACEDNDDLAEHEYVNDMMDIPIG